MKSALLRPDDNPPPREDTDQAINVRPYNSDQTYEHDSEDDFETDHSDFNNDNDNDYSDNDDDDDDDDHYGHDEEAGDWTKNKFSKLKKYRRKIVVTAFTVTSNSC